MTVNIPTYTKSSRIYRTLAEIMKTIEAEQEKQPKSMHAPKPGPGGNAAALDARPNPGRVTTSDVFVQYQLARVIDQYVPQLKRSKLHELQLSFATLSETSLVPVENYADPQVLVPLQILQQ